MTWVECPKCHTQIAAPAVEVHLSLNHRRYGEKRKAQMVRCVEQYGRMTKKVPHE